MEEIEEPITWDQLHALMDELRAMARALLAQEGNARSLHPTGLVLTALRRQVPGGTEGRTKVNWDEITWPNRRYFFGAMYQAMWCALLDHARNASRAVSEGSGPCRSRRSIWRTWRGRWTSGPSRSKPFGSRSTG